MPLKSGKTLKSIVTASRTPISVIAERLAVSRQAVHKYFRGNPSVEVWNRVLEVLDEDMSEYAYTLHDDGEYYRANTKYDVRGESVSELEQLTKLWKDGSLTDSEFSRLKAVFISKAEKAVKSLDSKKTYHY